MEIEKWGMIITDDPPVALTFANDFCLFRWISSMDSNQFMVYMNSHHIVLSVLNNRCEWPYSQETLIFRHSNHRNFQYVYFLYTISALPDIIFVLFSVVLIIRLFFITICSPFLYAHITFLFQHWSSLFTLSIFLYKYSNFFHFQHYKLDNNEFLR